MYCWFQSFFGEYMRDYLWGYNCATGAFTELNKFNLIGLIALFVSLIVVILYYYIINHPKFSRWWSWLIMLGISGGINFLIGYLITRADYINGRIPDCLMFIKDENGQITSQLIWESNCVGVGIANIFISTMFFIIFSFILKWWSSAASHSPFI